VGLVTSPNGNSYSHPLAKWLGRYSRPLANLSVSLLSTEPQPDEIERSAHAYQEANEGEVLGVEEVVCRPADSAPEEQARDEIAEDRPERILFATVSWFLGHWVMVDEFSTSDN